MLAFISHSNQDSAIYSTLCLALNGAGVERWDPSTLSPGELLAEQLREAIRRCDVCVFIATRQSISSRWCLAELGAFWGAGKRILLFKGDSSLSDSDLPPQFNGSLWTNDAPALIAALNKIPQDHSLIGNRPANLFWLGHDLARTIRFTMFKPSARDEIQKLLRQALYHLDEIGLDLPAARKILLNAFKEHSDSTNLSNERQEELGRAIADAKNDIGDRLGDLQPGFRGYPKLEEMRELDEEVRAM